MSQNTRYRYYCNTESTYVYETRLVSENLPTQCVNNPGHSFDSDSLVIVERGVNIANLGLENYVDLKKNLSATIDPSTTNDTSEGYEIGSIWINTIEDRSWICVDATENAAIWKIQEADIPNLTEDTTPNGAADYVLTYDSSASAHKKVLMNNLPGAGGGVAPDLAICQIIKTSSVSVTTSYTNLTFDTTDIETDPSVVEHHKMNRDRIEIKSDGFYEISYHIDILPTGSNFKDIFARVLVNDSTTLTGSETAGANYGSGTSTILAPASRTVRAQLTSGQYLTVQIMSDGSGTTRYNPTFTVKKLEGSVQGPAGSPGEITWKGEWTNKNYKVNEAVQYQGSVFVCKRNTTINQNPTFDTYWELFASKGDQGEKGLQGDVGPAGYMDFQGNWVNKNYIKDQGVMYQGEGYVCILDTTSNQNPSNATYWKKFAEKGDDGATGSGSSIVLKNNMANLANTPHTSLNFAPGSLIVTDVDGKIATITAVFGSHFYSASKTSTSSSSTASWSRYLRLTTQNLEAGKYLFNLSYSFRGSSFQTYCEFRVQQDDATEIYNGFEQPYNANFTSSELRLNRNWTMPIVLTSGVHTFDLDFQERNSGTMYVHEAHMIIYRVA